MLKTISGAAMALVLGAAVATAQSASPRGLDTASAKSSGKSADVSASASTSDGSTYTVTGTVDPSSDATPEGPEFTITVPQVLLDILLGN